jgi:CubicO group peptidase (beta-lactamase class C family)
MRKRIRLALMAGWVAAFLAAASAEPKPDFSAVREFIKTEMGVGSSTPSIAVAVARGNEILWEEGFGRIDGPAGTVATPDTLYYVASVTKAITATALMILSERKQLDLDRPANLYLKTAKLRSPYWNADEATVRRIATHTAGLATYDSREQIPAAETIRRYGIVFRQPGDRFDYSNLGFGILGQIIADVSGRSYQAFVHDEVLRPLALKNAWAGATPMSPHPVAPRFSSLLLAFSPPLAEPTLPGASVLYCSAHELALFGMFHLKARLPTQKAVLSGAGIDGLQDQAVADGDVRHSLAWTINDNQHGYRTLLAQGGTYDSQAWLLLVPSEHIVVVVLANAGDVATGKPIDQILSILLPTYRENLAKAAPPVSSGTAPAATAASAAAPEFAGRWSGEIRTHRGNRPLAFAITSGGEIEATLGKQTAVKLTNVRVRDNRLTGRMPGDLGIDYAGGSPYELRFELYRHENKLIGSAYTNAVEGRDGPRLPFWVELKRGGEK